MFGITIKFDRIRGLGFILRDDETLPDIFALAKAPAGLAGRVYSHRSRRGHGRLRREDYLAPYSSSGKQYAAVWGSPVMSKPKDFTGKAPIYQCWDAKAFAFDTMHIH